MEVSEPDEGGRAGRRVLAASQPAGEVIARISIAVPVGSPDDVDDRADGEDHRDGDVDDRADDEDHRAGEVDERADDVGDGRVEDEDPSPGPESAQAPARLAADSAPSPTPTASASGEEGAGGDLDEMREEALVHEPVLAHDVALDGAEVGSSSEGDAGRDAAGVTSGAQELAVLDAGDLVDASDEDDTWLEDADDMVEGDELPEGVVDEQDRGQPADSEVGDLADGMAHRADGEPGAMGEPGDSDEPGGAEGPERSAAGVTAEMADQPDDQAVHEELDEPDEPVSADEPDEPVSADEPDEPVSADEPDEPVSADEPDEDLFGDDYEELVRVAERTFDAVDRALARLGDGSYGTCEACGGPIDDQMLEGDPTATTCERHLRPV